jgi:heme-degrading monooxygenase HmoA
MLFVSVTRLRVRSIFYLPQFIVQALRSSRQAERAPGFLVGALMREPGNVFWTITVWQDDAAMNSYRTQGVHRSVMPRLLNWCDEASIAHWTQDTAEVPSWQEAHRRMVEQGRPSKVNHPSPAHLAHQIPAPRPGRFSGPLRAAISP